MVLVDETTVDVKGIFPCFWRHQEREHCHGPAGDNVTDSPQALPEEQEDDTEYERHKEAQRPKGIHIQLAVTFDSFLLSYRAAPASGNMGISFEACHAAIPLTKRPRTCGREDEQREACHGLPA